MKTKKQVNNKTKNSKKHRYSCAKCNKRTDIGPNFTKNRRLIRSAWMKDFFVSLNVDLKLIKFVCLKCYRELTSNYKNNTIFQEHSKLVADKFLSSTVVNSKIIEDLSSENCLRIMGINKEQFANICSFVSDDDWNYDISKKVCIGLNLIRLRSGLSVRKLVTFYPVSNYIKCNRMIHKARSALYDFFVVKTFGLENMKRGILNINHTTDLSKRLFEVEENNTITVWDGTYIYIEKSSNYTFQKLTYSMHKHRHLLKMMLAVSTTGFIVDCFGPYLSNGHNNDASIMKNILDDHEKFTSFFRPDDHFVVDRGFRDCLRFLEEFGIKSKIPAFLFEKQHSDLEANESRLVTKVRWVVESVNGLIKQWNYFKQYKYTAYK